MTLFLTNTVEELRKNSTLRHEDYVAYDREVLRVAESELTAADDIINAGLTFQLPNIGITESRYERIDNMTAASVDMDTATNGIMGRLTFDEVSVPVPVFHKEFRINERQLVASRNSGVGLDVTQAGAATRVVREKLENMVVNGIPASELGTDIWGYTTHPHRGTYTIPNAWDGAGADPVKDVLNMITEARLVNKRGPYVLYVCENYYSVLEADYSANKGDLTLMQRLGRISSISQVKVCQALANNTVALVQMDRETVDMAVGRALTNFAYSPMPGQTIFRVDAIQVVRIKADKNNQLGVVIGSV
jgi:hypothetical protein